MLFLESYLEICISCYLGFSNPLVESFEEYNGEWLSYYLSIFGLVVSTFVIPGVTLWIIFRPKSAFNDEEFQLKWSVLFEDINTNSKASLAN